MRRETEIERLYDEHAQPLFAFLLNFTRDEADTRDLLQEIFVKPACEPKLLAGVRDERAFLIRLAHNAAIDLMRRRGARDRTRENFAAETGSLFAATADPDERYFRDGLAGALAELPEEQRAVVHLKLWEGLTFEEIAAALDISPNTAASRYRYGLDKLRDRLRPLHEEMEQFERRLRRQPLRQIPAEWRGEILDACRGSKAEGREQEWFWPSALVSRLSTILWPHPRAWAGLAAVWILIFAVDFSMRDKMPVVAEKAAPPSPEVIVELKQQQRMLAELIGANQTREAEPPRFLPLPRSERVEILMT